MDTTLQSFTNEQFGSVRTVLIDSTIWFVAADVCKALDISNSRDALSRLDADEKADVGITDTSSNGVTQRRNVNVVNEPGLYRLVFQSRKPDAKKFQRWIFHDVIPSIRENGFYATPKAIEAAVLNPDFVINVLQQLKDERDKVSALNQTVGVLQPKAEYCDAVLNSPDLIPITQIAKDYGMSAIKFNRLLNALEVQYKQGHQWVLYQKYAELGWAATKTYCFVDSDNTTHVRTQTYWTQAGKLGIYQLLKKERIYPISGAFAEI